MTTWAHTGWCCGNAGLRGGDPAAGEPVYNTTAPGIILVLNKAKRHPGVKGRPKNELTDEHVVQIARLYHGWRAEEGLSAIIPTAEAVRNDYN